MREKNFLTSNALASTVARLDWMKCEIEQWRSLAAELLGDDDFVTGCPGHAKRVRELVEKVESENICTECGSGPGGST